MQTVKMLVENYGVDEFYIGNHGNFDSCALSVLRELQIDFPQIKYKVVLAYLNSQNDILRYSPNETIMFDGFETVPLKFAISHRNNWMIKNSDVVVSYIVHAYTTGGAAQFARKAKNKICINIADFIKKQ